MGDKWENFKKLWENKKLGNINSLTSEKKMIKGCPVLLDTCPAWSLFLLLCANSAPQESCRIFFCLWNILFSAQGHCHGQEPLALQGCESEKASAHRGSWPNKEHWWAIRVSWPYTVSCLIVFCSELNKLETSDGRALPFFKGNCRNRKSIKRAHISYVFSTCCWDHY